jgi:hypothetical protein
LYSFKTLKVGLANIGLQPVYGCKTPILEKGTWIFWSYSRFMPCFHLFISGGSKQLVHPRIGNPCSNSTATNPIGSDQEVQLKTNHGPKKTPSKKSPAN